MNASPFVLRAARPVRAAAICGVLLSAGCLGPRPTYRSDTPVTSIGRGVSADSTDREKATQTAGEHRAEMAAAPVEPPAEKTSPWARLLDPFPRAKPIPLPRTDLESGDAQPAGFSQAAEF